MPQPGPQIDEKSRIADQLKRAFEGDAWHGPAVLEVLDGVNARAAASKPLAGAHSIWELVLHIAAWDGAIRRRMEGQALQLSPEQDFPPVKDTSDSAWRAALDNLKQRHAELIQGVLAMPDHRLTSQVPGKDYDFYHMLHGAVQHELYHAGQIALLKKVAK
ncbi:MAG TPA: DinB family protein [Terriglobales bacterium]|nr:DinB family protein [Terriglobales bacterium]